MSISAFIGVNVWSRESVNECWKGPLEGRKGNHCGLRIEEFVEEALSLDIQRLVGCS